MKKGYLLGAIMLLLSSPAISPAAEIPVSDATQECLDCHSSIHPGIIADWQESRHAKQTVAAALKAPKLSRRVSAADVPDALKNYAVGCAECHLARSESHSDTFDHNGHPVHIVVSPADCAVCHATEAEQYGRNIMSHARGNLADNPVYQQLQTAILDLPTLTGDGSLTRTPASSATRADACYHCHGTRVESKGVKPRETVMGEMDFPSLSGWPNQGVGRVNPDNSKGSCAACHTRHAFSIAMARKADTCKQCHVGPDVPAAKVYEASKHGNIYAAMHNKWNLETVPWTIGKDFTAPTCAACHMSLLTNGEGDVVARRTHQISDRLPHRIYGLIYPHAHPKSPDTTLIRNKENLPLPTSLDGTPAAQYLISEKTAAERHETLQAVCLSCHSATWVTNHFNRLEAAIAETNTRVKTATELMGSVWQQGWAQGLPQKRNLFDEAIEKRWTEIWLFYANSIRFAAAMAGGGDYGVFADGRYQLSANIAEMVHWMETQKQMQKMNTSK